jgi:uncharacterized repeat protein (TIGR03803 family)
LFSKMHDFDYTGGNLPFGAPLQATDGKLYGQTTRGGTNYGGVIYSWDPLTSLYKVKHNFNYNDYPKGSLIQAGNGKIYGLTSGYYIDSKSTLYEYDPFDSAFTTRVNFEGISNGAKPMGSLIQGSNGKLYGLTKNGGANDKGVLFEWDPATGEFVKLVDFKGIENGASPNGSLLEISHPVYDTIYVEECKRYVSPSGKYTFSHSGVYKDFLISHTGCDSVVSIFLKIKSSVAVVRASACRSYISPSGKYTWTKTGIYADTIPNHLGCDSIITVDLAIKATNSNIGQVACDTFTSPSGRYRWTTSGIYNDTIPNSAGCDSIITVHLKISKRSFSDIYVSACNSYILAGGNTTCTTSGIYMDTIPNSAGCDSVMVIHLTVIQPSFSSLDVSACYRYTSPSGKYTWQTGGAYTDTIPSASGCDSIISIHLKVNSTATSTINISACDTYKTPGGKYTWTSTGVYSDTIPSAAGCDSVITIHLQIDHVDTSVIRDRTLLISNDENANHQWIDCDNGNLPIPGETYLTYTAQKNGHYAVIVSNGACVDTSGIYEILMTGINEPDEAEIKLYPNPTTGNFTIDLGQVNAEARVTISGYDGQVIQKKNFFGLRRINLTLDAPAGIYMISITTDNEKVDFKMVKN